MMTSIDDTLSEIRWLRNGIWRCRRLLNTDLPGTERKALESVCMNSSLPLNGSRRRRFLSP